MAELATLRCKRSGTKQKLTTFRNYFESLDQANLTDVIINQLNARLERITPLFDEFNEIQFELEAALAGKGKEIVTDEHLREEFERNYFSLIGDVQALCDNYNKIRNKSANGSVVGSNTNSGSNRFNQNPLVKLPPIKLPVFDGQYSNWLEFKDSFVALVDNDTALTNIQTFYNLRSSLDKNVLEIIKSLEVSGDNYNVAWKCLADRFENKKLIIYNHIRAIFEHPNVTSESYSELRNLYGSCFKTFKVFENYGGTEGELGSFNNLYNEQQV